MELVKDFGCAVGTASSTRGEVGDLRENRVSMIYHIDISINKR